MKQKITVMREEQQLRFYLHTAEYGPLYLFSKDYTPGVYHYFRRGRSVAEIRSYRGWDRNPALDKIVMRIPAYIKYVLMIAAEEYREPERVRRCWDEREIA